MENPDPYVVKRFTISQRLLKAFGPGLLTLAFLGAGISNNLEQGRHGNRFLVLIICAGFGYWTFRLWIRKEVRELATTRIPATPSCRSRAYLLFFLGFAVSPIAFLSPDSPQNYLIAFSIFLFFLIIGGLMLRPDKVLTRAAREEQGRLSSVFTSPSDSSSPVDVASDAIESSLNFAWRGVVTIAIVAIALAVLIVPFFFAPWWAIVIIWLLILIAFK